jgi:hypothetical protein
MSCWEISSRFPHFSHPYHPPSSYHPIILSG